MVGGIKVRTLETLRLRNFNAFKEFSVNSITFGSNIQWLDMTNTNMEVIKHGAFSKIHGLLVVVLINNKLKILPSDIFNDNYIAFYFQQNPLDCNCFIIRNSQKFYIYFGKVCTPYQISKLNPLCNETNDNYDNSNIQLSSRKCSDHYGTNTLRIMYSNKFLIRVLYDKRQIYIKSSERTMFFILTFGNSNPIDKIKCFMTIAKYSAISFDRIQWSNDVFTICIVEVRGYVWPYNCITFQSKLFNKWLDENEKTMFISLMATIYISIFLLAILLGICITKRCLILMVGVNRVLITRSKNSQKIESVLIMPVIWVTSHKAKINCTNGYQL